MLKVVPLENKPQNVYIIIIILENRQPHFVLEKEAGIQDYT